MVRILYKNQTLCPSNTDSLPPIFLFGGGGLGRGVSCNNLPSLILPPTPALPRKGGGRVYLRKLMGRMTILGFCLSFLLASHALAANNAPTSSKDVFPALPQSRLCNSATVQGIWKLLMVYEVPSGNAINLYTVRPLQYLIFDERSNYGEYISTLRDVSLFDVKRDAMFTGTLQQYKVNNSGIVFFYRNSVAADSFACFIVANPKGPFEEGQMLLMPPPTNTKTRMVKVYQKISGTNIEQQKGNSE